MKTVRELADHLSVSYETARILVASGQIKASNISEGTRPNYRITDQAIEDFLESRSNVPDAKPSRRKPARKPQQEWV